MYHVIYRQLSPVSHLNVEGIQSYVNENEAQEYIFNDGDNSVIVVCNAIEICVAFAKDLYDLGVIQGEKTLKIKLLERLLGVVPAA